MTLQKLQEAQELSEDIAKLEKLVDSFSMFYIGSSGYSLDQLYHVFRFEDEETNELIRQALQSRLDKLKAKFANI